ncbi:MAG: dethiobiotin synthase [Myxococcota bacterium]
MIAFFITGSDTGCGKTTVGVVLARAARRLRRRVRVLKPVETGCAERDGELQPADALALAVAAQDTRELDRVCPYRLARAAAPEVAARAAGIVIEPEQIERAFREASRTADLVLVEGAGGLVVPITSDLDMAGLAERLSLPLLLVVRARLGTLNHTLLSLEAAQARGLEVAGVVVSHDTPELSGDERANLDALVARLPSPFLGELPFAAKEPPAALLSRAVRR